MSFELYLNRELNFLDKAQTKKATYFVAFSLILYHLGRIIYFVSSHSIEEIMRESIWK